jgi:hypothetical protein
LLRRAIGGNEAANLALTRRIVEGCPIMVTQAYILHRAAPPSRPKVFFDQQVIPALIDGAASIEARVENVANYARTNPLLAAGAALGIGLLIGGLSGPRRPSAA